MTGALNLDPETLTTMRKCCKDAESFSHLLSTLSAHATQREAANPFQLLPQLGYWELDHHTGEIYWSERMFEMLGIAPQPPTEQLYYTLIHPNDRKLFSSLLNANAAAQQVDFEYRVIRPNGELRYQQAHGARLLDPALNLNRYIGIVYDITERKQQEQARMHKQLEHYRSEILSGFIRDASHEFRTPLSILNTKIYMLERQLTSNETLMHLQGIRSQSDSILALVESLVTLARLDAMSTITMRQVCFKEVLDALKVRMSSRFAEKSLKGEFDIMDVPPHLYGNVEDLYCAFTALLDNAIRYTPPGGTITIRQYQSGDYLRVEVQDTGSGIQPEDLPHIFNRFYRADKAHSTPGFGLGLPIAQRVIRLHHGDISVESQPGNGSCFRVKLPLTKQSRA
jgi:PAS domain S-box-containing protein